MLKSLGLVGLLTLGSCEKSIPVTGLVHNPLNKLKTESRIFRLVLQYPYRGVMYFIDREGDGVVDEVLTNPKLRDNPTLHNFYTVKNDEGFTYKIAFDVPQPTFLGPHEILSEEERSALSVVVKAFYKHQ